MQDLILTAIIIMFGALLYSVSGFGFGMLAIPLLMMLKWSSYDAIAIVSVCASVQALVGIYTHREHFQLKQAAIVVGLSSMTIPIGVWLLGLMQETNPALVRQVFGGMIMLALLVQLIWKVKHHDHVHWGWTVSASATSGVMSGMAGMGGPPIVMWVMGHNWSGDKSRVLLWCVFTGIMPIQIILMTSRFGTGVLESAGIGALFAPAMLLGALPGWWIGKRISKAHLKQMAYIVLFANSLHLILRPYLFF